MEIFAIKGHKVKCSTLSAGYEFHQELAKKHLTIGDTYTVDYTNVDSWHTDVFLEEIPNVKFNSVFFEDVESQSDEDTKTHPDYRRYNEEW